MEITLSKLLSLLAVPIFAGLFAMLGPEKASVFIGLVSPLAGLPLIWFGEEMGDQVGGGNRVDSPTPGWMLVGLGWIFLIGMPVLILIQMRKQH